MGLTKKFTLTVAEVMGVLLANDGADSLVDADMVDGLHASEIIDEATTAVTDLSSYTAVQNKIPIGSEDGTLDSSWFPDNIAVLTFQWLVIGMSDLMHQITQKLHICYLKLILKQQAATLLH